MSNLKNKKNQDSTETEIVSSDKTIKIYQRDKIGYKLKIAQPKWSEKQLEYIDLVRNKDTKIVLLTGPAGSSKTFINLWIALELLNIGRIQEIICVRSVVESSSLGLGYLPGSVSEKLQPYAEPFFDKIKILLPKSDIELLLKDERIQFMPVNYLRGREFNASFIFIDECQNFGEEEMNTVMTRFGKFSKMILGGDKTSPIWNITKESRVG
jgi:phosphate starvation-inducible PhoH-like protein